MIPIYLHILFVCCIPTMRSDVWPQTSLVSWTLLVSRQTSATSTDVKWPLYSCVVAGFMLADRFRLRLRVGLLVPPFHVQYVYIYICKYVCNICTSSIDSGTCTRIWSYVHMEGCGLGWAVNVCRDLRTDLKLFQAGGTLPWCLQAHRNIKLLEVQAITRPWHAHVCQNVKFRNWPLDCATRYIWHMRTPHGILLSCTSQRILGIRSSSSSAIYIIYISEAKREKLVRSGCVVI